MAAIEMLEIPGQVVLNFLVDLKSHKTRGRSTQYNETVSQASFTELLIL